MQRCPRTDCCRAGSDIGNCGDFALKCPTPVDIDFQKTVVLRCRPCGRTWAVTVSDILRGKASLPPCTSDKDECRAVVVTKETAVPKR